MREAFRRFWKSISAAERRAIRAEAELERIRQQIRGIHLTREQHEHLRSLMLLDSEENRKLAAAARDVGDEYKRGFHLGQALAYRRMAQRWAGIEELDIRALVEWEVSCPGMILRLGLLTEEAERTKTAPLHEATA